jgi:hypothetical protein
MPELADAALLHPRLPPQRCQVWERLGRVIQGLLGKKLADEAALGVVAEDITAGEILGEYLGEFEHVCAVPALRPRNEGSRLVMRQPPERPSHSIRIAINGERMGCLMRFVNHSCAPVAQFGEVANGPRTTVVVAVTHDVLQGEEITADYGEDLWFVCRCGHKNCCHRDIQDQRNP